MSGWMRRRPVTAYVVLVVGLSWAVWLPLLAQSQGWIGFGLRHLLRAQEVAPPPTAAPGTPEEPTSDAAGRSGVCWAASRP